MSKLNYEKNKIKPIFIDKPMPLLINLIEKIPNIIIKYLK